MTDDLDWKADRDDWRYEQRHGHGSDAYSADCEICELAPIALAVRMPSDVLAAARETDMSAEEYEALALSIYPDADLEEAA